MAAWLRGSTPGTPPDHVAKYTVHERAVVFQVKFFFYFLFLFLHDVSLLDFVLKKKGSVVH